MFFSDLRHAIFYDFSHFSQKNAYNLQKIQLDTLKKCISSATQSLNSIIKFLP